ncbi:uncharacterized protein LY89DRAFT_688225 [Mollisia scopiformis]|uniref:Uncharacterized protein n=1 Tax=Mollisia scopiformis TaxID=149040 RepID=A0A194WX48_MOLSC|nr:uncharacterized protein LY89DRAFT_688225 [Mollisia scopiformis]KUJ12561.1 hypothetical protein LY89DRAFT_688225 [Mollisia scopiformis]
MAEATPPLKRKVIDLTNDSDSPSTSPIPNSNLPEELDPKFRSAVAKASLFKLRTAILELCKQMPEAVKILEPILISETPPPQREIRHAPVRSSRLRQLASKGARKSAPSSGPPVYDSDDESEEENERKKQRTVRECEYGGGDADTGDDGCCKFGRMDNYKIEAVEEEYFRTRL